MANLSSPTVSVVMPTYNRADLLPRAIKSISSQDFDDFELLIVDDGSVDNTAEVIKQIQAQDPRLRYIKLPQNRGVGFARQIGLQHASGKYIAPADSDDLWMPGKLNTQIEVMETHPEIDILFGDFWNINHVDGTVNGGFDQHQAGVRHLKVRHINDDLYFVENGVETGVLRKAFVQLGTFLFRAKILEKVGGFTATLRGAEDIEFCWRSAVLGAQFAYINRPLVERHKNQSSITVKLRTQNFLQILDALAICCQTCITAERPDLIPHIRAAEQRTWRILIRAYSEKGERGEVWWAFRKSLRHGFTLRTFAFFLIGMAGPRAISFAIKSRARSLQLPT